jgi:hypothetical protein
MGVAQRLCIRSPARGHPGADWVCSHGTFNPGSAEGTSLDFLRAVNMMDQYSARARPPSRTSALVGPDHPTASLPRRRLAVLRPGGIVEGVITRLVRGGALVDIQLESNEPAFLPLRAIPIKAMPVIRDLIESGDVQAFRIDQLDRGQGTATLSVEGLIRIPAEDKASRREVSPQLGPLPEPPTPPLKPTAGEIAKQRQRDLLRRMREEGSS